MPDIACYSKGLTRLLINAANPQLEGRITGAKDSNGVLIAEAQLAAGK